MHKKIVVSVVLFFVLVEAALIYLALTITPITLKRNRFTYEYGSTISTSPEDYFNAHENILMNVQLDLTNVSSEVGIYNVSGSYFNKTFQFEIEVADTIKPKFQLKKVEFDIDLSEKIYAKDLIKEVEDLSKTEIYFIDEQTKELSKYKSYTEAGSYIERIIVEDAYGNQSASLRVKITVHDNRVPPVFKGIEDVIINIQDDFDPLSGVRAIDDLEGDISERIIVTGTVNTAEAGIYHIEYSVQDKAGNIARVIRKVTVRQ